MFQNALPMSLSAPQSSVIHLGVGSGEQEGEGQGRAGREESLDSGARLSPPQARLH